MMKPDFPESITNKASGSETTSIRLVVFTGLLAVLVVTAYHFTAQPFRYAV